MNKKREENELTTLKLFKSEFSRNFILHQLEDVVPHDPINCECFLYLHSCKLKFSLNLNIKLNAL